MSAVVAPLRILERTPESRAAGVHPKSGWPHPACLRTQRLHFDWPLERAMPLNSFPVFRIFCFGPWLEVFLNAWPCLPKEKDFTEVGPGMRKGLRGFAGIWSKPTGGVTVKTRKGKTVRTVGPAVLPPCHLSNSAKKNTQNKHTDVLLTECPVNRTITVISRL